MGSTENQPQIMSEEKLAKQMAEEETEANEAGAIEGGGRTYEDVHVSLWIGCEV